jgi:hypothetical protein
MRRCRSRRIRGIEARIGEVSEVMGVFIVGHCSGDSCNL